ncbi:MAG: LysM peptidoglycan-binding domain-containing protein [Anaerolineales bacterium]
MTHSLMGALLFAGVLTSSVRWGAVGQAMQITTSGEPPRAITGCSDDRAELPAIAESVASALTQSQARDPDRVWSAQAICHEGDWAYAFIQSYSRTTLEALVDEHDVALLQRSANGWESILPENAADYNAALSALPVSLIPKPAQALLTQPVAGAVSALRYSAHALPYPYGVSAYVIKHWYPAVDFSIGANAEIGTVRSTKAGTAVFVKGSSTRECGHPPPDWYCWQWANAVVVQSGPAEYIWYLHLAPNSIPAWIQEGAYIPAGTDIGLESATGWAVSPHLHFMVASIYSCCLGEGDSRIPGWPQSTTHRVDFTEYTWENLPWSAVSQNGTAPANPSTTSGAPPANPTPTLVPAEPTSEPAPASLCPNPYIVQRGDWLLRIADHCSATLSALLAANPGINPNLIYAGQLLNIPGSPSGAGTPPPEPTDVPPSPESSGRCAGTYVVAQGENLFRIGFNCGFTTEQMAMANGIWRPYTIYPGQVLRFP